MTISIHSPPQLNSLDLNEQAYLVVCTISSFCHTTQLELYALSELEHACVSLANSYLSKNS